MNSKLARWYANGGDVTLLKWVSYFFVFFMLCGFICIPLSFVFIKINPIITIYLLICIPIDILVCYFSGSWAYGEMLIRKKRLKKASTTLVKNNDIEQIKNYIIWQLEFKNEKLIYENNNVLISNKRIFLKDEFVSFDFSTIEKGKIEHQTLYFDTSYLISIKTQSMSNFKVILNLKNEEDVKKISDIFQEHYIQLTE